jgi:hypothetical protein
MEANESALERIRKAINTADALHMRSSAVLVSDLKCLLDLADQYYPDALLKTDASSQAGPLAQHG